MNINKERVPITKYRYMVDGNIPCERLALTREMADASMTRMWGECDIEYVGEALSHYVGDFEASSKIVVGKSGSPLVAAKSAVGKSVEEKMAETVGASFSGV